MPLLLEEVRAVCRMRHLSLRTEQAYISWIKRFIVFHHKRHPREMAEAEIRQFISHLAVEGGITASTQTVALSALLFLYRDVLKQKLPYVSDIERARKPKRLPTVFTREETKRIFANLEGARWLVAGLLYGSGLRLMECLRLRVKDIDFTYQQITVRDGKGEKDRVSMLPAKLREPLTRHLQKVKLLHDDDVAAGYGEVFLPYALARKYRTRRSNGAGSTCFLRGTGHWIRGVAKTVDITCQKPRFKRRSKMLFANRTSPRMGVATPLDIALRRTCWNADMTFGQCRNC
jgi:integron integrase